MSELERVISTVKKLTEYTNNLGELENGYDSGLTCYRKSGRYTSYRRVAASIKTVSTRPIGIEYRFRFHEGQWEVGFFNDLGNWKTYDKYSSMEIARAMAMRLSKTQPLK